MVDLYNRIHQTCTDFAEMADRIAALDPEGRGEVVAGFDSLWNNFELSFGGIESFRLADRSRRTRFLLDLIAAEARDGKAGRLHAATGAALLTLLLRGVKYATRDEVERMWHRIERLREASGNPHLQISPPTPGQMQTVH